MTFINNNVYTYLIAQSFTVVIQIPFMNLHYSGIPGYYLNIMRKASQMTSPLNSLLVFLRPNKNTTFPAVTVCDKTDAEALWMAITAAVIRADKEGKIFDVFKNLPVEFKEKVRLQPLKFASANS